MKYEVEIEGRAVTVDIDQRDSEVEASVDGRVYQLNVASPEGGVFTFLQGDRVYEARVFEFGRDSLRVEIKGHLFTTKIIDRKHRRATAERGIEGRQTLVAPMPGKVVRVLVVAGEEVKAGQGVVVVEAMKMQNEIKSPKAGRLIEVRVSEGATVDANQVLAVVE
ncbi:MAG TPA: biotin/lipoyl-containing protein [Blastocatellia bacterium]|nr:biotin/lipoyl-containing protein [Blastocatellia bacterium]